MSKNFENWERGDALVAKTDINELHIVTFLAWSVLDGDCFIGEDEDGIISDDYVIDKFRFLYGEG